MDIQLAVRLISIFAVGTLIRAETGGRNTIPQLNISLRFEAGGQRPSELGCGIVLASRMFAEVGIELRWQTARLNGSGKVPQLYVQVMKNAPAAASSGALAFSAPFRTGKIIIFWDRLQKAAGHGSLSVLLAYVLAHEIIHVLTASAVHTNTGLMKAHWTDEDIWRMSKQPLPFNQWHIKSIHQRLGSR